jgi:hypothetical protein
LSIHEEVGYGMTKDADADQMNVDINFHGGFLLLFSVEISLLLT